MEEIEKNIDVVLEMLLSESAWAYQRHKSHTEEKSIDAFVARNIAKREAKQIIQNRLELL
jgi:hypothetical protein